MAVIGNTSCKKCILKDTDIKSMLFYHLKGHAIVFEFIVSVINLKIDATLMGVIYFETV